MPIPERPIPWLAVAWSGIGGYRFQKVNENISAMVMRYNRALDQIVLKGLFFLREVKQ